MKHKLAVALTLVVTIAFSAVGLARDIVDKNDIRPSVNKSLVEANLLAGIQSDNFGLRTSSAMMLGDIQSAQAVFPLMHMLKHETDERARIVAALSLVQDR